MLSVFLLGYILHKSYNCPLTLFPHFPVAQSPRRLIVGFPHFPISELSHSRIVPIFPSPRRPVASSSNFSIAESSNCLIVKLYRNLHHIPIRIFDCAFIKPISGHPWLPDYLIAEFPELVSHFVDLFFRTHRKREMSQSRLIIPA